MCLENLIGSRGATPDLLPSLSGFSLEHNRTRACVCVCVCVHVCEHLAARLSVQVLEKGRL